MRVLVTGAGGFIGSHLAENQAARGRQVVAFDVKRGFLPGDPPSNLHFVQGDIRDRGALREALLGVNVVFHLASAHLEVGADDRHFYDVNVSALGGLLADCRAAGVGRFVHCSSVGVYGDVVAPPADERSPCRPVLPYERSKLAGEEVVLGYHRKAGLPVVVLRPAWVYGPRCRRTEKLLRAVEKGRFVMFGRGTNLRHPVFIGDMLEAFELASVMDAAVGETIVIGSNEAVPVCGLVRALCEAVGAPFPRIRVPLPVGYAVAWTVEKGFGLFGRTPPISTRTLSFFTNNNAFSIAKAKRLLGFEPAYDLERGLRETTRCLAAR